MRLVARAGVSRWLQVALIAGCYAAPAWAGALYYNSGGSTSTSGFYVLESPNASPPYSSPSATQPCGTFGGCPLFRSTQNSTGATAQVNQTANLSDFPQAGTGMAAGNAQAQVLNGQFHISTSSQAQSSTPGVYTEVDTTATATLDDEIQLNSSIYPVGTSVTVGEILQLHDSMGGADAAGQGPCTSGSMYDSLSVRVFGMTLSDSGCQGQPLTQTTQTTTQAKIGPGPDLEIFGYITAESDAFAQGCAPGQSVDSPYYYTACYGGSTTADVNALDTASIYLVLPQGVTLTSGSGWSYSMPTSPGTVPEPSSWILLLTGCVGMGVLAAARKRLRLR